MKKYQIEESMDDSGELIYRILINGKYLKKASYSNYDFSYYEYDEIWTNINGAKKK